MIRNYRTAALTAFFAGASLAALHAQTGAPAGAQAGVTGKREILLQSTQSWNGKPYTHYPTGQPELTTIRLTIAPHTVLPWHQHPVPNSVYVLSGTLTLHDRDSGKTRVVHAGEAVGESVDAASWRVRQRAHRAADHLAGTPGVPTSVPAKGEKPEY